MKMYDLNPPGRCLKSLRPASLLAEGTVRVPCLPRYSRSSKQCWVFLTLASTEDRLDPLEWVGRWGLYLMRGVPF